MIQLFRGYDSVFVLYRDGGCSFLALDHLAARVGE